MKPFIVNRNGRLVFPSNYFPDLDFSVFRTLEQFAEVVRRDFEDKAPTGTEIVERINANCYKTRFDLLRDIGLHLFWVNRFSLTMYEKRPTRWRDVPRGRDDVFLPVLTPWEDGKRKVAAVADGYQALTPAWDATVEDRIFHILFDVLQHKLHHATELPAIKPTVPEMLRAPGQLTFMISSHNADYPVYTDDDILNHHEDVPELEALGRWARVLHNQYPWEADKTCLREVGQLDDDDFVVLFHARDREVRNFVRRAKTKDPSRPLRPTGADTRPPVRPYPPIVVRKRYTVMPRLEALAVVKGEHVCANDDVVRNSAFNWSPMSAHEISAKTGINQRLYTGRSLEDIALEAAAAALKKAGRSADEIGAVLFCSCTSGRLIPSAATWLSGELGMMQTHASCDLVAACAGFPYGLAESVRLLQEVERPVLLVCAEKFSDKIGSVRTSRMIFGDGAAAVVVAPGPDDGDPDIEVFQTYASGPVSQVNSIVWPNPLFDNNITVYGPEVKALAERYLRQMVDELRHLPAFNGGSSLLSAIELVVPHQANKTMVVDIAKAAGIEVDQLYFNIDRIGNVSAASIPLAIHDAIADGVIDRPTLIFAPGFGAGAVAGYAVLRIDPEIAAPRSEGDQGYGEGQWQPRPTSSEDVHVAFAG